MLKTIMGVSLVVQHLTEKNYSTWSRVVLIALDAKTKLNHTNSKQCFKEYKNQPKEEMQEK